MGKTRYVMMPYGIRQAAEDDRLSAHEKVAMWHFWLGLLDAAEYRPMKAESLAHVLKVKRQSASRILKRLVECGYLLVYDPPDKSEPRQYLIVQEIFDAP